MALLGGAAGSPAGAEKTGWALRARGIIEAEAEDSAARESTMPY